MNSNWQPMTEQPPKAFAHGDVAVLINRSGQYAIGRSRLHPEGAGAWPDGEGLTPPYRTGERVPVREEWRLMPSTYAPALAYKSGGMTHISFRDLCDIPAGWEQMLTNWQPADTMPNWAVRNFGTVASCIPEQRDGVWGWLTTFASSPETSDA